MDWHAGFFGPLTGADEADRSAKAGKADKACLVATVLVWWFGGLVARRGYSVMNACSSAGTLPGDSMLTRLSLPV
jgi:hypothetical protein